MILDRTFFPNAERRVPSQNCGGLGAGGVFTRCFGTARGPYVRATGERGRGSGGERGVGGWVRRNSRVFGDEQRKLFVHV